METLQIKILIFGVLLFFSCKNDPVTDNENYKKLSALLEKEKVENHNLYLVVAPFVCKGCVEEQLIEFFKNEENSIQFKTILVADTHVFSLKNTPLPSNVSFRHRGNSKIDSIFPDISNLLIVKRTKDTIYTHLLKSEDEFLINILKKMN